jgi:hypothetical protein
MNKIQLFLLLIFLSFSNATIAQNVKPTFKQLTFVTYRPSGKGDKKFIRIEILMNINNDGMMHRMFNIYYDYFGDLSYTGMLGGDTTYRVPDSLVLKLNEILADNKNMVQQTEFRKLPNGVKFNGPYEFVSCTNKQGDIQNLIITDIYDKNIEFRNILRKLLRMRSQVNRRSEPIFRDPALEATILKYHNDCKNLPEIIPISPGNLEIADPGVKH